ncbi:hypothetical protein LCGC14_0546390 [marine sediment metagenome]|nr:hypothetical protein [bacterium]
MKLKDSLVDYKEGKFINGNYESEQDIKDALSEEKIFIFEGKHEVIDFGSLILGLLLIIPFTMVLFGITDVIFQILWLSITVFIVSVFLFYGYEIKRFFSRL